MQLFFLFSRGTVTAQHDSTQHIRWTWTWTWECYDTTMDDTMPILLHFSPDLPWGLMAEQAGNRRQHYDDVPEKRANNHYVSWFIFRRYHMKTLPMPIPGTDNWDAPNIHVYAEPCVGTQKILLLRGHAFFWSAYIASQVILLFFQTVIL